MLLGDMSKLKSSDTARNRQGSDAKWRANILICYELLKNICTSSDLKPSQTKAGRITRLGSLQMAHQQIQVLEKIVSDLLADRSQKTGFDVTLDDIHLEFAELTRKVHRYQVSARRASLSTTNPSAQPILHSCEVEVSRSNERLTQSASRATSIADSCCSDMEDFLSSRNTSPCADVENNLESLHQWCEENELELILKNRSRDSQPSFAVISDHLSNLVSASLTSSAEPVANIPERDRELHQEIDGKATCSHLEFRGTASCCATPDLSASCSYTSPAAPSHILQDFGVQAADDVCFDQSPSVDLVPTELLNDKREEHHRPPSLQEEYHTSDDDMELYNNFFYSDDGKLLSGESDPMLSTDIRHSSAVPILASTLGDSSLDVLLDMEAQSAEDFQMLPDCQGIFYMDDKEQ